MDSKLKREKRFRRHKKVRSKIFGTVFRPRLGVFRSNQHIYCQLIDDEKGQTLTGASDLELAKKRIGSKKESSSSLKKAAGKEEKGPGNLFRKVNLAFEVGKLVAEKALKKKIGKIVFDRGGYKYHGKVKAVAEGAREGGLKF